MRQATCADRGDDRETGDETTDNQATDNQATDNRKTPMTRVAGT
jgi:hypothetical protein